MNLTRYLNVVITGVIIFLAAMTILLSPHELISQSRKLPSPLKLKDSLDVPIPLLAGVLNCSAI